MNIRCFLVEETGDVQLVLRRYATGECTGRYKTFHNAEITIGRAKAIYTDEGYLQPLAKPEKDDPRWPVKCDYCDYHFQENNEWQLNQHQIYAPAPGNSGPEGEKQEWLHRELPPGAMLYPSWLQPKNYYSDAVNTGIKHWQVGPDGKCLMVVTPGGEWIIDSRASNCTLPEDNEHRCWCRHGDAPWITVDKNGLTCGAGAGSIQCGDYHGFLRDGYLVD